MIAVIIYLEDSLLSDPLPSFKIHSGPYILLTCEQSCNMGLHKVDMQIIQIGEKVIY
jgi:hypothetical protein